MNYKTNILCAALVCSILGSCGVYSKYEREDVSDITDSLYDYVEASSDTTNIASLSWRELFADPLLQSLVEVGLESNTDLNVARLSVDQAEIALKSSRLAYLPSLGLSADGTYKSFDGSTSKSYEISASASWEIDIFGKLRNAKEQSKAALEGSEAYRQAVQTELISTIANSYYTLIMLDEQLDISRRTLENWADNLRVMELLKRAGRINETSVLQSEGSMIALQSSIVTLEEQIALLEGVLSTLLAQPTEHIERGTFAGVEFPESLAVGVPMQLLSNRPDVRVAEYNLTQMFYATAEARSAMYPSITLSGGAGFTNSSGSILNPGDMLYSAVGSIVQPLFYRGTLRAQLKISESQQEQALLQFQQSLLDAGNEVNAALISWQSAKGRIDFNMKRLDVLSKAVRSSELLMKSGNSDYLEVLTAQLSLLQTELSSTGDHFDEIQSVIDLYRALGGGEN